MSLQIRNESSEPGLPSASLARFGRGVLKAMGRCGWEVSVLLVDDAAIRKLNRRWRGIDRATDVLSFPAGDDPRRLLGDVVISVARAGAQAQRFGVTKTEELRRLLIHGMLHLMGYDHVRESERRRMRDLERRLLKVAGRPAVKPLPGLDPV